MDAGSIDADVKKELDPFVSKGLLTITPFEDILQYDLPAQGQVLPCMSPKARCARKLIASFAWHGKQCYAQGG